MSSIYQTCAATHGDEMQLVLQCISNMLETETKDNAIQNSSEFVAADFVHVDDLTNWLLILTGALVFFMQAGFAMVCAGAIRKKNLKNTVRFYCCFIIHLDSTILTKLPFKTYR
jgi:hypothetical protein